MKILSYWAYMQSRAINYHHSSASLTYMLTSFVHMLKVTSTKMLCASARTQFIPSILRRPILRRPNRLTSRHSHVTMSTTQPQIIEHIVLFKVKPDVDPSKLSNMITGLNALTSLNLTLHLTAGPLLHSRSSSLTFTHILHSRYKSKHDLTTYAAHPDHVRVVTDYVKPIIDDVMAVDWISNTTSSSSVIVNPGSAIRVTFLKLKEDIEQDGKARVLELIRGMKDEFGVIEELSVGENFSHERAKGYTIASVAVFAGKEGLEALDANEEVVKMHKEKVKDLVESVVVVDYVVPVSQGHAANL